MQAKRVGGTAKIAGGNIEVECVGKVDGSRVVERLVAEGQDLVVNA